MRPSITFSPEYLHERLILDPETGILTWRPRPVSAGWVVSWNLKYADRVAGSLKQDDGYVRVRLDGIGVYAQRIVWAMTHGYWPEFLIDHIDTDRGNNRPNNLRPSDYHHNGLNRAGSVGVYPSSPGRFYAAIRVNNHLKRIGTFNSYAEAAGARAVALREFLK